MSHAIEQKLQALNITLPQSAPPAANYIPYTITGNQVFISGNLPIEGGKMQYVGKLGREFTIEQGKQAARLCGINILAQIKAACGGDLSRVKRIVKLGIFVSSAEGFTDQPQVANGVSDLMVDVFGDAGKHARFAMGASELPFGVAVEVDAIVEIA